MIAYKAPRGERYTPNTFARIGLWLLTLLVMLAGFGLLLLLTGSSGGWFVGTTFWGLILYAALEFFVHEKRHFRSGVDDSLLLGSVLFVGLGLTGAGGNVGAGWTALVLAILCTYGTLRFADRFMAVAAMAGYLAALYLWGQFLGTKGNALMLFFMATIALGTYIASFRLTVPSPFRGCLYVLQYASLAALYISLNYYFIRETSPTLARYGWLFWLFTFALPPGCIFLGIRLRNRPALHVGMATLAASVLTFRYYHSILPPAEALTLGGLVLLALAYGLIRYLKKPRVGFTSEMVSVEGEGVELLAVTQAFGAKTAIHEPPGGGQTYGGGSFGGGGAGGDY